MAAPCDIKYQIASRVRYRCIAFLCALATSVYLLTMPVAHACASKTSMVLVRGGEFVMGSNHDHREEGPEHKRIVRSFLLSSHEVSNAAFAEFVAATGYITLAERGWNPKDHPWIDQKTSAPGSVVFEMPELNTQKITRSAQSTLFAWRFVHGASWRTPQGPGSNIKGKEHHPVVHIATEDAEAYARWKGMRLPTEVEWEYAAYQGRDKRVNNDKSLLPQSANTWQGKFLHSNTALDGYVGTAPVGCYAPNALGIYDMLGNVWEWTNSWYHPRHQSTRSKSKKMASASSSMGSRQPNVPAKVIKGGSYLCSKDFCARYRPSARQPQEIALGTSHIGFRLAADVEATAQKKP